MYTTPCSGSSYVWYVKQNRRSKYSIVTDYIIVRFRKFKQLYELRQCRLRLVDLQRGVGWKRTIESDSKCHLIMRPNIVVDYRNSSIFFYVLFSSPTLRARWTEFNQNRSRAQRWVRFENACPKSAWGRPYTFLLQIGDPKATFSTISQLNGNFNGLYLQDEMRYT